MAYPLLSLCDTSNIEIESIDFGIVGATGYSSEIELRVWNDYGAVEGSTTAYNVLAKLLNEDNEELGDPITQKWVEYKIGKAGDTATPEHIDTEWSVMGINSYPSLGTIQQNTYRTLYLRLHAPVGVSTEELTLNLSLGDGITPTILSDFDSISFYTLMSNRFIAIIRTMIFRMTAKILTTDTFVTNLQSTCSTEVSIFTYTNMITELNIGTWMSKSSGNNKTTIRANPNIITNVNASSCQCAKMNMIAQL